MENQEQQQQQMSKRDSFRNRLSQKYPDMAFDDEEVMFDRINSDYDDYDKRIADYENSIEQYKGRERELGDMFTKDPRSGVFLNRWRNGGDPTVELIRMYGQSFQDALQDPEKLDAIAAANKEFAERVSEEERLEADYKKNLEQSLSDISALQEKEGYTDEQIGKAMDFLQGVAMNMIVGKITPEVVKMALNAMDYDKAVETASMEGELRGRNTKIQEKLRKREKGDGVPQMGGKNGAGNPPAKRDNGALDRMSERKSIWD